MHTPPSFAETGVHPQIYTRDPRLPIPPLVMASSAMGLNMGAFSFFSDHTRKTKCKTNAFTISAHHAALYAFVFTLIPQYMQVTYAPDEPHLF